MRLLRGFLMSLGLAVPSLTLLFLLNVGVHRLLGPTGAQREALATLEAARETPREGKNAFATLWLMIYDVAEGDIERIAGQDVREARARDAAGHSLKDLVPVDRPRLAGPDESGLALCKERTPGCLEQVRANPEAARAAIAAHPRMIERMHRFEGSDYYRFELPWTFDTPLPDPGASQRLRLTSLALAWHDGRRELALAELCGNIGAWRHLRRGTNSLIFSMIAVSFSNGGIQLLADMLAELPATASVPAECVVAFAPIDRADVSLCGDFAGEFEGLAEVGQEIARQKRRRESSVGRVLAFDILMPLVHSDRQYQAWMSTSYAEACGTVVGDRAIADTPMTSPSPTIPLLACASAAVSCNLASATVGRFDHYHTRLLDAAASLRLGATVLWLRETHDDPRPLAERFAARPEHLRSGTRATGIGDGGRSIWVANRDTRKFRERTTLPLAPSPEASP